MTEGVKVALICDFRKNVIGLLDLYKKSGGSAPRVFLAKAKMNGDAVGVLRKLHPVILRYRDAISRPDTITEADIADTKSKTAKYILSVTRDLALPDNTATFRERALVHAESIVRVCDNYTQFM